MRRDDLTNGEFAEYIESCKSGKLDKYVYTQKQFEELKTDTEEVRHGEYSQCRDTWIMCECKDCGEVVPIVLFTGNIHKYKTICSHCYRYIKFGFPFKDPTPFRFIP